MIDGLKILLPFSWLYKLIIYIRNLAYDFKLLPIYNSPVPIISVGNLTTGGTGKTPFVEFLIRYFLKQKVKLCVVSRGYKRSTKGTLLVSDGKKLFGDAISCGDEPYQIANKFREIVVIVDEKRKRAIHYALRHFSPNVIILDDGFQHRAVARNLDILIIDSSQNLSKMHILPTGKLREPFSSLKRADLIVFNNIEQSIDDQEMSNLRGFNIPKVKIHYKAAHLHSIPDNTLRPIKILKDKKCIAFCGVGNPNNFKTMLMNLGCLVLDFIIFPDHHFYSAQDLMMIEESYKIKKADYILTTEKDAVRLNSVVVPKYFPFGSSHFIEIEVGIIEGENLLMNILKERVGL